MRKIFYFLIVALALIACKGSKDPQVSLGDKDTEVVEEISEAESDDGYVNLGTVKCVYTDQDEAGFWDNENAVLFAKELNNNITYYYVCPQKGGKKYPVRKCDPSDCWGFNGTFSADDLIYYVYIQSWDDTH